MSMLSSGHGLDQEKGSIVILEGALSKLENVLLEENAKLEGQAAYEHGPYVVRKNQILRELMILQRADDSKAAKTAMADRLRGVRELVEKNHQLLQAQLNAMNEITSILTKAALAESADGTYSRKQ